MYKISYTESAEEDLKRLKKEDSNAFRKACKLLDELSEHPTSGTGIPKPLREDKQGAWSRRITQKHRLVYEIHGAEILVPHTDTMTTKIKDTF